MRRHFNLGPKPKSIKGYMLYLLVFLVTVLIIQLFK